MIASIYDGASNFVHDVDRAFYFILGISFFFFFTIIGTMIFFVVKYNRKKNIPAVQMKDNLVLEIVWTIVPLILVTFMFFYGYYAFIPMRNAPKDAIPIKVTARMWQWSFEYAGNKHSDSLVVPLGKAVKLDLYSPDVIHGFYIPSFRLKEDVVPGKKNYTWFIAQEEGDYELLCSSYCGVRHSYMGAVVKVVKEDVFNKWLAALPESKADITDPGLALVKNNGCLSCHTIDGAKLVGPTFKGLFGSTVEVEKDGQIVKVLMDEKVIQEAIYKPDNDIVKGFPQGVMKSYEGIVSKEDAAKIVEYLKTLKSN